MPLDPDILSVMLDTVHIEPATGKDKFNKFTYGPTVAVQCQIVRMNQQTLDRAGRETISTVQVILGDPELDVSVDSRLTLPDGTHPDIIEVLAAKDDVGPYYLEIRA